jgi:hypothetical protein
MRGGENGLSQNYIRDGMGHKVKLRTEIRQKENKKRLNKDGGAEAEIKTENKQKTEFFKHYIRHVTRPAEERLRQH